MIRDYDVTVPKTRCTNKDKRRSLKELQDGASSTHFVPSTAQGPADFAVRIVARLTFEGGPHTTPNSQA